MHWLDWHLHTYETHQSVQDFALLPSFLPPVAQVVECRGRVQYLESLSSSPFGLYLNVLFRKALKTFIASNSGALPGESTSVNSYHLGWEECIPSQENEWVRERVNCQLEVWRASSVVWKGTLPTKKANLPLLQHTVRVKGYNSDS